MLTALVSRLMILAFGTLYPAYASYKAVRTKDVKEYVKWMMYWIVFALFTCAETFTDVLFSFWFPFYYEIKVAIVFWLLSPATKGSSFLYRNFVHPAFQKRESEIDEMLHKAKERGYNTVLNIGSKGVSYATNVILQTAIKGGGGIMEQLRKSYSLTDLSPQISKDNTDGSEDRMRPPTQRRARQMESMVEMNFPEVETNLRGVNHHNNMIGDIRSTEDISSGFSSTDQLNTEGVLTRSSSVASTRTRPRGRGAAARRAPVSEDAEESDTELWTDCSAGNTGASQVPTPQSIPSGANLEFIVSQTSATVSRYASEPYVAPPVEIQGVEVEKLVETDVTSGSDKNKIVTDGTNKITTNKEAPVDSVEIKDSTNVVKDDSSFCEKLESPVDQLEPEILDISKSTSQCSVNSDGSDAERKGKYKKLPAPKPPSKEPSKEELTIKPEVDAKISGVNETNADLKETNSNTNLLREEMRCLKFIDFD